MRISDWSSYVCSSDLSPSPRSSRSSSSRASGAGRGPPPKAYEFEPLPNIRLDPMMEHSPLSPAADTRDHLIVIGNGMAGCAAGEEVLLRDTNRYGVTIFGA